MSLDGVERWFDSLPFFQQVFFGLFVVLVALPIATLILFQFIETLRGIGQASRTAKRRDREKK